MNLRQKTLVTYLILFLVVLGVLYPLSLHLIRRIVISGMEERVTEAIQAIEAEPDDESIVVRLKQLKPRIFFRVGIISDQSKILYDTHIRRLFGPEFSQEYVVDHPEVNQAFTEGFGYHEEYSALLQMKLAYMAKAFDFHGKNYVLRMAFPYDYILELTRNVKLAMLGLSVSVLLLFSFLTWLIINYLTKPIRQVVASVQNYQEGKVDTLPRIEEEVTERKDDVGKLATTLNSLSRKVEQQISSLTFERNEKEAVLESLAEGVIAVDAELRVLYINGAALRFVEARKGKPFRADQAHPYEKLLAQCVQERQTVCESLVIKKEHEKFYLDLVAAPLKEHGGAILVIQDNSAHYKMLEMRKDFIANASHELKTPITIIRGFAETLHDNPALGTGEREEVTGTIVRNCVRMNSVIEDLLILSDIERLPEERLSREDLFSLLQRAEQSVCSLFPEAVIMLRKEKGAHSELTVDAHLMEMAFLNLIQNAAKYSLSPAEISVVLAEKKEQIVVTFSDQGLGIPKEDLPHIFERFYRVSKERSRTKGGSGLGLSIVETIIEKHAGTISVHSELGVGTTFIVRLPR